MEAMSLRGYWRTLRPPSPCKLGNKIGRSAFEPAITITKLTTIASTGRFMKRSVNDFILMLRIGRGWVELRLGREFVVDRDRYAVTQFENASAHNRFACLQSLRDRNKIP